MKRIIPVFIAIVLIIIVAGVSFGAQIREKYSYSKERADLNDYFGNNGPDEAAIILQDERLENEKALVKDGTFYVTYDTVSDHFIYTRLYVNEEENEIRYVLPDRILKCGIGEKGYTVGSENVSTDYEIAFFRNDTLYVALDFIRLFVTFDFTTYEDPNHVIIYTEYEQRQMAEVKKDTQVRVKGGVKSEIIADVSAGDTLIVLETLENWTKVRTDDGYIGYVENKRLNDTYFELPIFAREGSEYGDLEFPSQTRERKINMAWHQIGGVGGNATLDEVLRGTKAVNVISPTWFHLTGSEGEIESYASQDYVAKAHDKGMEVWALVDDFTEEVDEYALFVSAENRERLISNLINSALTYGLDGINIDFELIGEKTGKHFVEFIRELSIPCRENGIVLSIDNYPPSGGAIWYNRREQGVYADYVIIMGYDEHWKNSSEAGSVASIDYVENGIRDTLEYVPAEKVINAIPFYTRVWKISGTEVSSEAVGMEIAKQFVSNHGLTPTWREDCCQNYAETQDGNTQYKVWLEDADSIKVKLDVMDAAGIAGVAEWKLGFETPDIWELIEAYVQN